MHVWKHLCTITHHRHIVMRDCFLCGIGGQGLLHDLSKYSPTEFWVSAAHYQGNRSPNDGEREDYGYSLSWMHHKGRNRHHHEYWTDYSTVTHKVEPVKMPLHYVVEMFCDRIAACRVYQGDAYTDQKPLEYFYQGMGKHVMHPDTAAFLQRLLLMLAENGEEQTFRWIRRRLKESRNY